MNHLRPTRLFTLTLTALLVVSLLAPAVLAQDSVSLNTDAGNGLPGDAISPHTITLQRTNFVLDLVPFQTSWGTTFALGPVIKAGKVTTARFSSLAGPSVMSAAPRLIAPYPNPSYVRWTQPGGGIDFTNNNSALSTTIPRSGTATVFAISLLEYSDVQISASLAFWNEIIGAQVAFDPAAPSRLYVTRVVAACNSAGTTNLDRSQFGLGAIDSFGDLWFRADSLTASNTSNLLAGENYFRVRLPLRTNVVNLIDSVGASHTASSTRLLNNGSVTVTTPTVVPRTESSDSLLLGANLAGQLIRETSANVLGTTADHLAGAVDHRGNPSFSTAILFPGTFGTGAILSRTSAAQRTDAISLFGVRSAGNILGTRLLTLPASVQDSCTGTTWPSGESFAQVDFRQYESQVTFRGGNGPVAVGLDAQGRALVAATAYSRQNSISTANPHDAILVARFDPAVSNSPVTWTAAVWTATPTTTGKSIAGDFGADGIPGTSDSGEGDGTIDATPIGRVASMSEVSFGKEGPSISAPMIDAAGNIWCTAAVALNTLINNQPATEYTTALLRGVYDPATFCYRLELVLKVGDTFAGANSARNYRIAYLGLADADSIASEAPWSGSMSNQPWNNVSLAGLEPENPKSLGGLALSSRIVYDRDADGDFEDPTLPNGNFNSADEAYDVVLYVGNIDNSAPCPADLDDDGNFANGGAPDGGVDINDLLYFLVGFEAGATQVDLDNDGDPAVGTPDGGVDVNDLLFFLARFESGC